MALWKSNSLLLSVYPKVPASKLWHDLDNTCYARSVLDLVTAAVCLLASRQQYLFDKCLLLYAQSWTADDGPKDRPKRVDGYSKINKFDTLVHLVGFLL